MSLVRDDKMEIEIIKAEESDCKLIHKIQLRSFQILLNKYNDPDINPGAESLENILNKFKRPNNTYCKIMLNGEMIGAIRLIINEENHEARISPIFIIPEYEGRGLCQKVMLELEKQYFSINTWKLDTILEEQKLNYLYEKLGYKQTGRVEEINENMHIIFYEKKVYAD